MDPLKALPPATPLTADQQAALKKLHAAATQLEGVFVGMLYKEMQSTVPKDGILGKQSNAESMWQDMLADKQIRRDRAERLVRHRQDDREAASGPGPGRRAERSEPPGLDDDPAAPGRNDRPVLALEPDGRTR